MCVCFTGLVLCRVARFLLCSACSAQLILLLFPSITSHAHSFTRSLYFSGPRFRLDKLLLLLLLDIISSISKLKLPVLRGAGVISTGSGATSPPAAVLEQSHQPASNRRTIQFLLSNLSYRIPESSQVPGTILSCRCSHPIPSRPSQLSDPAPCLVSSSQAEQSRCSSTEANASCGQSPISAVDEGRHCSSRLT